MPNLSQLNAEPSPYGQQVDDTIGIDRRLNAIILRGPAARIALSGVNAVSQQVQYVNVGVTLQIAPRVSEDGFVTSHSFCEVSSVTGYSQGYPTISQREASTTATVMDGEYFVIGGLTQENKLTSRSQVPVLGDIPGIGELFKLHIGNASKTQLYIVVTPHIVRAGDTVAARAQSEK